MTNRSDPARRARTGLPPAIGLLIGMGAIASAEAPRPGPGAAGTPSAGSGDRPAEPGQPSAGTAIPTGRPPSTAERVRITVLGGNPLFALDWLAPSGARPEPPRAVLPLP